MSSSFSGSSRRGEFTVFVANIPLNAVPGDIDRFFAGLNPKNVSFIRDNETDAFKGYCYVDFDNEEKLLAALARSGNQCFDKCVCFILLFV